MSEKKITVALHTGLHPFEIDPQISFSAAFNRSLTDKEEEIRNKIIIQVNEIAGDAWKLQFSEYPVNASSINVDIKSDPSLYQQIVNIIVDAYTDISFLFFEMGTNRHIGTTSRSIIDPETKSYKATLIESRWPTE